MPIESIQCPKCGSVLEVESTAKAVTCGYCGGRLRITRGASGHPLGVLEDIKVDTEIIAKQTAINHLRERLQELLEERERLDIRFHSELSTLEPSTDEPGQNNSSYGIAGFVLFFVGLVPPRLAPSLC